MQHRTIAGETFMRKVTDEEFRISSVMIGFVDQSDVNAHSCKNRMNNSITAILILIRLWIWIIVDQQIIENKHDNKS